MNGAPLLVTFLSCTVGVKAFPKNTEADITLFVQRVLPVLSSVRAQVSDGYRLPCPENCPRRVFDKYVAPSWDMDPKNRPTFAAMRQDLSKQGAATAPHTPATHHTCMRYWHSNTLSLVYICVSTVCVCVSMCVSISLCVCVRVRAVRNKDTLGRMRLSVKQSSTLSGRLSADAAQRQAALRQYGTNTSNASLASARATYGPGLEPHDDDPIDDEHHYEYDVVSHRKASSDTITSHTRLDLTFPLPGAMLTDSDGGTDDDDDVAAHRYVNTTLAVAGKRSLKRRSNNSIYYVRNAANAVTDRKGVAVYANAASLRHPAPGQTEESTTVEALYATAEASTEVRGGSGASADDAIPDALAHTASPVRQKSVRVYNVVGSSDTGTSGSAGGTNGSHDTMVEYETIDVGDSGSAVLSAATRTMDVTRVLSKGMHPCLF